MDQLTVITRKQLVEEKHLKETEKTLDQMTLKERGQILKQAMEFLEDESELTSEEMETIGNIYNKFEEKVAAWGLVIQKLENSIDINKHMEKFYSEKANSYKQRALVLKNRTDRMKEYMKAKMIEFNIKKVETPTIKVGLRKKSQALIIKDDHDFSQSDLQGFVKLSKSWDKAAIRAAIKSGLTFQSAQLSEPDFSVTIK